MAEPIFISSFFLEFVLPFILVFTLVFAILQKTKLLGEGKKQIDSLVSLVIGIILIAFPFARDVVVQLMPFLAVFIVVLLVFMLLYGFVFGSVDMSTWVKVVLISLGSLGLITALLYITGAWDPIYNFMFGGGSSQILVNALLIIVIAVAMVIVLTGKSESE